MSHTVTAKIQVSRKGLLKALQELNIPHEEGIVRFFDGTIAEGLVFKPEGWHYAVVCKDNGDFVYDNYKGEWGDLEQLNRIIQQAAYHDVLEAAETHGFQVNRVDILEDGTIQIEFLDVEG